MRVIALAAVLFLLTVSAAWSSAGAVSGSLTRNAVYASKGPTGHTGSLGSNGPVSHVKTRWRATLAPLPANASTGSNQFVSLSSISCASRGNCTAVGSYLDNAGHQQGLLLTEKAGHWGVGVEAVLPANAGSDPQVVLASVSCASAGNCTAVGAYTGSGSIYTEDGGGGLLLTEKAGHWAPGVEAVLPASAGSHRYVTLHSVSCASAGNCTAVGRYGDSEWDYNGSRGLLLTEEAGLWKRGDARGGAGADVFSVSCSSDGSCSAVGYHNHYYYEGRNSSDEGGEALLLTKKGATWRRVEVNWPAEGPGGTAELTSVSCTSAGNCSAAGLSHIGVDESEGPRGVLLTEIAGKWHRAVMAKPPKNAHSPGSYWDHYVGLVGISCASPGNCAAMGGYYSGRRQLALLTQQEGKWRRGVGAAVWRGHQTPAGAAISCASPGNCTVVGGYVNAAASWISYSGFLLTEIAGRLGAVVRPPHFPNALDSVSSVSCAAPGTCGAVGANWTSEGPEYGVLLDSTTDPCVVPRLKGNALPRARHRIEARNCFVGTIEHIRSPTVARGHVISQSLRPGRHLAPGTKVNLEVSSGGTG